CDTCAAPISPASATSPPIVRPVESFGMALQPTATVPRHAWDYAAPAGILAGAPHRRPLRHVAASPTSPAPAHRADGFRRAERTDLQSDLATAATRSRGRGLQRSGSAAATGPGTQGDDLERAIPGRQALRVLVRPAWRRWPGRAPEQRGSGDDAGR